MFGLIYIKLFFYNYIISFQITKASEKAIFSTLKIVSNLTNLIKLYTSL